MQLCILSSRFSALLNFNPVYIPFKKYRDLVLYFMFFVSTTLICLSKVFGLHVTKKNEVFNSQKLHVTITSVIFNCMYFHSGFLLSDFAVTTLYIVSIFVVKFGRTCILQSATFTSCASLIS